MDKQTLKRSIACKALCIVSIVYGCTRITEGLNTFTKFTTLSNLFLQAVMLLFLVADLQEYRTGKANRGNWLLLAKFVATVSILITFLVYLTVLAPTNRAGFLGAYLSNHCGSLALHAVAPILGVVDFFCFTKNYVPTTRHILCSMLSPLLYMLFIVALSQSGYRWGDQMHAPYNFINFGAPTGWWGLDLSLVSSTTLGIGVGYMVIILAVVFPLLGLLLARLKQKTG